MLQLPVFCLDSLFSDLKIQKEVYRDFVLLQDFKMIGIMFEFLVNSARFF